jgi:hypothetical protein
MRHQTRPPINPINDTLNQRIQSPEVTIIHAKKINIFLFHFNSLLRLSNQRNQSLKVTIIHAKKINIFNFIKIDF